MALPAASSNASGTGGSSCTLIDFEGLANLAAIPTVQGVSLPDWLSIIEENAGGSGNFSGEPSPVTIAFWLYGDPTFQSIQIPNGASSLSFYYASYYPITASAYDSSGKLLTTVTGPSNFDFGTYSYDIWAPLQVTAPSGTTIATLTIAGYANYTGIDNLNVCQAPAISSVEVTQAIQQYQTLTDLQASLSANGEPPVPIIADKPAALRVYFKQVQDVTHVTLHLSGVTDQTKSVDVQPGCTDMMQRAYPLTAANGCQSMDFYFTPPSGAWTAKLDTVDSSSGMVLATQTLNVKSRSTDSLRLRGVSVCDSVDANSCQPASALLGQTGLLSKIAPTSSVTVDIPSGDYVHENFSSFADEGDWFDAVAKDVNAFYGLWDAVGDFVTGRRTTYFGEARATLPSGAPGMQGGVAAGIPSHAAVGRQSAIRLGVETNIQLVAHETGHTLGLKHTNTIIPVAAGGPPGCYNLAGDKTTSWPFGNNYIQSAANYEYGFDVAGHSTVDPKQTFEIMSYCVPRWISPINYKAMISTLDGGSVSSPSAKSALGFSARPTLTVGASGSFWQVQGSVVANSVTFQPLFQVTTSSGNTTPGTGSYSLLELDGQGNALFTRAFTPGSSTAETTVPGVAGPPSFAEVLPAVSGAAAFVVKDPNNQELGRITLSGSAPVVTLTTPGTNFIGSGTKLVSWTVSGGNVASKVLYSVDGGVTWSGLGDVQGGTSLPVDFDRLAGSTSAVIRVLVSDGVNTGAATSPLFTVSKKLPSVIVIDNPVSGAVIPAVDPVFLSGSAYDADDGVLKGSSLAWSSDVQGSLGSGSPLSVHLQPGKHVLTLTATDSDSNQVTATTTVLIAGGPPALVLQTQALNTAPTSCESATITATPGVNGAPLSLVQYSVDGGSTYTTIPLGSLPYKFIVPGSGFLHVVARAFDTSNQASATDATFLTASTCQTGPPLIQGAVTKQSLTAPGKYAVAVTFTNIGSGTAKQATLTVSAQRLSGTGTVTYTGSNPITLPSLAPGQSTTVSLSMSVPNPNTVTRFRIVESGSVVDVFGSTAAFSTSQQVIP